MTMKKRCIYCGKLLTLDLRHLSYTGKNESAQMHLISKRDGTYHATEYCQDCYEGKQISYLSEVAPQADQKK